MRSILALALLLPLTSHSAAGPEVRDVEVVALDYAFQMPRELPAGPATFHFVNKGKVRHEFNVVLLKRGTTVQEYIAASIAGKPLAPMIDATIGVLFAKKGERSLARLSTVLLPDRDYAVRCIFRDTANAPRHQELGMYLSLHVTPSESSAALNARVDTVYGFDYAFRFTSTLSPGRHYFAFSNIGKQRHEFTMVLLKEGVTSKQVMDTDNAGGNVNKLFDGSFGALHSPAGTSPLGFLEVDLLPGREYMIECGFQDNEKSPPHYTLGMMSSFIVRAQ